MVVAIAAAAQCAGSSPVASSRGDLIPGFGWLPDGVVEPNFDPAHDRRLRKMLVGEGVRLRIRDPRRIGAAAGPRTAWWRWWATVFRIEGAEGDVELM